jgi:hypothetical protein
MIDFTRVCQPKSKINLNFSIIFLCHPSAKSLLRKDSSDFRRLYLAKNKSSKGVNLLPHRSRRTDLIGHPSPLEYDIAVLNQWPHSGIRQRRVFLRLNFRKDLKSNDKLIKLRETPELIELGSTEREERFSEITVTDRDLVAETNDLAPDSGDNRSHSNLISASQGSYPTPQVSRGLDRVS